MIKILYFRKDLVREKGIGKRHQHNSRINFFFKIMVASIISGMKIRKTEAVKTRKAKDVAGNEKKINLCNKCFGNYMEC